MVIYRLVGRKIVPWTDDKGVGHVSVQLHVINDSPAGMEGSEVEIVKCNPETIPLSETVKLDTEIFIQRNDKGRATDIVALDDLKGLFS